jgi:glycosyltransferase involved in cell wall biosynthesis
MMKPITCVHFVRELRAELGGVVSAAVDLCESMAAMGHRIILVTCDASGAPWRSPENGSNRPETIEVKASAFTDLLLSRQALQRFDEIITGADVAHLHTPWDLCNLQLSSRLRRAGIPYVVTVHGMLDDWSMQQRSLKKRTYLTVAGRRLFRDATIVHFTAQAEMEQALKWIPTADRAVVECYISSFPPSVGTAPALKAFPQIRPDCRRILFLSRLHPKKGVELLIRAAAKLRNSGLPFQLLIAGPGEDQYIAGLKAQAAKLGVAENTFFLGMVQGVEKRSLYELADVFVLPTYQENFGLVFAEAMSCGTAVVTTRGTDIWHELEAGGARIVDYSPDEIANAILEIVSDPDKCRALGQQGQQFITRWLDRDRVSAAYDRLYRQAIDRGVPPFSSPAVEPQGEPLVV